MIGETRPDIVHAHSPVLVGLPALRAARDHGLPFVYEVRDLWENASVDRGKFRYNSPLYRLARRLETCVLRRADAVVTICDTLRDDLSARVVDPGRVFVVGNGVDAEAFDPAIAGSRCSRAMGPGRQAGHCLRRDVSAVRRARSADSSAAADSRRDAPAAHLVIAGGSAGESTAAETSLQALVDRLDLRSHVTFTGRLPHAMISGVYALADIVVYPRLLTRTTALTTPLKPLEAMAMGRAVVSSDVPGDARAGARRRNRRDLPGRPAGGPGASVRAAARGRRALRRALGERARAWTVGHRRWPTLVGRYHGIYDQLAELTSFVGTEICRRNQRRRRGAVGVRRRKMQLTFVAGARPNFMKVAPLLMAARASRRGVPPGSHRSALRRADVGPLLRRARAAAARCAPGRRLRHARGADRAG